MRDYELRDLQTNLKVALAEAVMSRIVVTDREAGAFQTVLNVLSKLPTTTTEMTDEDWKRIGLDSTDIERLKEEK